METALNEKMISLINHPDTVKVLATTDREGNVHVVAKGSVRVREDGKLELLELIESSQTNKNLTSSIWFGKKVAFNFITRDGESIQIKASVERVLISGKAFRERYIALREEKGDIDLSGIWVFVPEEIREETFEKRFAEESKKHPEITHLDRIAIEGKIYE